MKNIFKQEVTGELIKRINNLNPETNGLWGKMNVAQMLAHCCVTYDLVYTNKHPKPNTIKIFMLKLFVKGFVVGEKPYPKNGRTAPEFLVDKEQNFELEQKKLIDYLVQTQQLGEGHFDQKESHSFGKLNVEEWNNLFYKHIDHHLNQFGV